MGSSLMETIWLSEKRRKLLILLMEGEKSPEEIKEAFGVSWRSLILPLKELREEELVWNCEGKYCLSNIGKLIVENFMPVASILTFFEKNTEYWTRKDLKVIPQALMDRIGEIRDYTIVEPDIDHMFDPPQQFMEALRKAKHIYCVFSIYHPLYPPLYCELAEKGTKLSLILTESVLERVKEDCKDELERIEQLENVDIHLYKGENYPPHLAITDEIFLAGFFDTDRRYDHRDIMSFDESSLKWGKDLFDQYCRVSDPL